MCVRKAVNGPVKPDASLYTGGVVKFFFTFNIIADEIAYQNFMMIEGKICVGQIIDKTGFKITFFVFYITGMNIPWVRQLSVSSRQKNRS